MDLLIYADSLPAEFPQNSVVILPPSDYWALRATLNVNSENEAAKYGPALFDLSGPYRYEAQKVGKNSYILIAYNKEELSRKLLSLPVLSTIDKLTFAQWVFADGPSPVHVENRKYLTMLDGIVIEMDAAYVRKNQSIELSEALARPRFFLKTIPVTVLVDSPITAKTLKTTLMILLILFGNLVADIYLTARSAEHLSEKSEAIRNEFKLPETSIEREAILGSLRQKETKQLELRHHCKLISDLAIEAKSIPSPTAPPPVMPAATNVSAEGIVLIPGSKPGEPNRLLVGNSSNAADTTAFHGSGIRELTYDGNTLKLVIDASDSKSIENLQNEISKRFKKARYDVRDTQLEVRIR